MNADAASSFRKTLLLVIAAHLAVAAIPITLVSLGQGKPRVAAGPPLVKLEDVKWLDPAPPMLKAPTPALAEAVVAKVPAPAKVATVKPAASRSHLGRVDKQPATKVKISPPQQVNFHPEPSEELDVDTAPKAPSVESPASAIHSISPQEEDVLKGYHARIQRVMESHWEQPSHLAGERAPVTKVAITISRDGAVSGVKLAASSGYPEVDKSALTAAHAVARIDPLPTAVRGDSYQVIIRFVLH